MSVGQVRNDYDAGNSNSRAYETRLRCHICCLSMPLTTTELQSGIALWQPSLRLYSIPNDLIFFLRDDE